MGKDGILSTPAVSCIIRKRKATGGIILTASHNPGGPDGDFGIKYNMMNGGPAPTDFTERIWRHSQSISRYLICKHLQCDISEVRTYKYNVNEKDFFVEIVDGLDDYVDLMKSIFDFPAISTWVAKNKILINSLHGVTGPYVERIFGQELGAPKTSFMKTEVLPDFGGGHPDPNLTYAADLVEAMGADGCEAVFGAAFDGDGDRNMILGAGAFFVTPCDSLAVIADNLDSIPYFTKHKITGYARSMPTSGALDRVAVKHGKDLYETPTGWKFFGNLLDAGMIQLCGEESFGTGSNHLREKDGIWAALSWLQILASKDTTVEEVLKQHWTKYGRNFFTRYDYENCESEPCNQMMSELQQFVDEPANVGRKFNGQGSGGATKEYTVSKIDNFSYADPVDRLVATNQGIRIFFTDGSRIVFRLSGTGSSGATVRLYVDSYEDKAENLTKSADEMLSPCVDVALQISKLKEFVGRDKPNVVT